MKWFLITLAIGLAASDKLDRTYLPPPGAHFAGGILGSQDAPLEPPSYTHSGQRPVIGGQEFQPNFGINGEPVNFGDKIPMVPVTTTSYAFSQTTTYPPGEGFETTALPINPVTGLPIQLEQLNFPYGPSQGQVPNFGTNVQPGFVPQAPTSAPVNNGSPGYDQIANQPLSQYPVQNVITPGGAPQNPVYVYPGQNQGQLQHPDGINTEQQGVLPTGTTDNQRLDQYPAQNVVNPGSVFQIPGNNQGLVQYPTGQKVTGQGFVPTTGSPVTLRPGSSPYGVNYDGSQGPIPQGTYPGQPTNGPILGGTEPTQISYQNQELINVGGMPSQYPNGNQTYGSFVPTGSEDVNQPRESPPFTIPSSYNNGVSSTTSFPEVPSSTLAYSSVGPVYRPERPQAVADRNAIILNYENIRTPNGYSYSFDTSNGIHADESGIVDNGTKAQGSYSYIGDDGKVYSVIYTADENGFQPRGDHLPTPPPIPEAIQRVIEQAARDKAAGIVHDGSYDDAKYGDHQYQGTKNHRRPQNQDGNQFSNNQFHRTNDDLIKPIVGIKDGEYDVARAKDQFNNNLPVTSTRKEQIASRRPSNQRNGENNVQDISVENGRVSGDSPKGDIYGNSMPIVEEEINQLDNYGTKKKVPGRRRPVLNGNNLPIDQAKDSNQNNQPEFKSHASSTRRPIAGNIKDRTETKYPGSNVDVSTADFSGGDEFNNNKSQDNIGFGSPKVSKGSEENMSSNFNKVTGTPISENKQIILRQRIKGNSTPGSTGNKNGRPQGESYTPDSTETPSFSDYLKNAITNQQDIKQDDTGYQYQQPNTKFEHNKFPNRFSPQETSSIQPDQRRNEYVEGTTRKPFMTPNVYNQNNRDKQSTPHTYNQNNINGQSTTRRPFTTIGVTSPTDYTDYDDGNNYATNQGIGDDITGSTKKPADYDVTSQSYQPTQTTSRPQSVPSGLRTHTNQKGTFTSGRRTENSGSGSPRYTYEPTTQMPAQNFRFGSDETPRRMKPQQRRPSTTVPDSATAVDRLVTIQSPSGTRQSDYEYQTMGPNSKYPGANVGYRYPSTPYPDLGSMSTTPGVSTPQDYYTSTYGPSQGYSRTTAVPPRSGYTQESGSQVPSGTPGSLQPAQDQSFHTGYYYGPPMTGSFNPDEPGFLTPKENSEVLPTSPTGIYETTYQQGSGGFPSTTLGPKTPGSQGTFIPSQSKVSAPESSPTVTFQGNYQNKPSTPNYASTIVSSTPGGNPVFRYPGSLGVQETTGYEYGPTRPTYSTTDLPSTIGTIPGSFIPSETTGPSQDSTTYRPGLQAARDTFVGGPVDGFGRPIITEQGGSNPGFEYPTQGTTGPGINIGPNFGDTDQSTRYPGSLDQNRVIGEDFSGPKQPQRYDPITGYHYK